MGGIPDRSTQPEYNGQCVACELSGKNIDMLNFLRRLIRNPIAIAALLYDRWLWSRRFQRT